MLYIFVYLTCIRNMVVNKKLCMLHFLDCNFCDHDAWFRDTILCYLKLLKSMIYIISANFFRLVVEMNRIAYSLTSDMGEWSQTLLPMALLWEDPALKAVVELFLVPVLLRLLLLEQWLCWLGNFSWNCILNW